MECAYKQMRKHVVQIVGVDGTFQDSVFLVEFIKLHQSFYRFNQSSLLFGSTNRQGGKKIDGNDTYVCVRVVWKCGNAFYYSVVQYFIQVRRKFGTFGQVLLCSVCQCTYGGGEFTGIFNLYRFHFGGIKGFYEVDSTLYFCLGGFCRFQGMFFT